MTDIVIELRVIQKRLRKNQALVPVVWFAFSVTPFLRDFLLGSVKKLVQVCQFRWIKTVFEYYKTMAFKIGAGRVEFMGGIKQGYGII